MFFDEVMEKYYKQQSVFKLLVVLMVLVTLLLGNILFIEPLMSSLTFYSGHIGCLISPMDMTAIMNNTSTKYFGEPFLKSGSTVDVVAGVNMFGELSLSLYVIAIILGWRKIIRTIKI